MIKKVYYWLHKKMSRPEERGEYSSGRWQDMVRTKVVELAGNRGKDILEVGCGEGLFLCKISQKNPELKIFGLDNWGEIIFKADKRIQDNNLQNISLIQGDASSLPFKNESFDTVVCINVFFNLPSEEVFRAGFKEIARVCKSKGSLIFDIRNAANPLLYFKYKFAKYYDETVKNLPLRTYKLSKIKACLKENNFKPVNKINIGFPNNNFAPIMILEAEKA